MGPSITNNPYSNLDEPLKPIEIKHLETKKSVPAIDFSQPSATSAPVAAPKKQGFLGSIFAKKNNDAAAPSAGANVEKLTAESGKLNNFNKDYPGLELSGNKPGDTAPKTPTSNEELAVNKETMEITVQEAAPVDPVVDKSVSVVADKALASEPKAVEDGKKEPPKNEEGSLGDLQAKKQEIVDSQKETAQKQLAEKSEKYQKLDEKSSKIDRKLAELNKNPEANKDEIAKLEGSKAKIGEAQSKMVESRATKLAEKDGNYQKLSKAEAKEQESVDKFKDFDLKDKDGNKIEAEDLKGKKLSDFVDKEGNVDRSKLEKDSGLKATYSQDAIKKDPQKVLDDPNASPTEIKKAERMQMMQMMQAMMGGGNASMAAQKPTWQQDATKGLLAIANASSPPPSGFGSLTGSWG